MAERQPPGEARGGHKVRKLPFGLRGPDRIDASFTVSDVDAPALPTAHFPRPAFWRLLCWKA